MIKKKKLMDKLIWLFDTNISSITHHFFSQYIGQYQPNLGQYIKYIYLAKYSLCENI